MKSAEKSAKSLERRILHRVREAVAAYRLIEPGDRILVALSGGKDSMALLHFLSVIRRSNNGSFDLKAVHVRMANVDYRTDLLQLKEYAEQRGTGFELLDAAFEPDEKQGRSACFLCSWTRRKALFNYAQANGYNKIALGHHRDDLLQTAMMNLTFNGTFATMPASLAMDKFPITLIRPLCAVDEADLRLWADFTEVVATVQACPYDNLGKRSEMQGLMKQMQTFNPELRQSLWHALNKAGKV